MQASTDELQQALDYVVETGQRAWPTIMLPPGAFEAHVRALLADAADPIAILDKLHVPDLYLACACAIGEPRALVALEQQYLPTAARAVARFGDPHGFVADAIQELRERVLVGTPPRIAAYAGTGSLESWLKVAAVRVAINLRARHREQPVDRDDAQEAAIASVDDPVLEYVKRRYQADFSRALREAFDDLSGEDRTIMRFYLVDRLNIGEIGGLVGISRATVGRRIIAARETILAGTRRRLHERLEIDNAELDSLIGVLQSRVDFSLSQVLGRAE